MKKKRKFAVKSIILFLIFFCLIAGIHITYNVNDAVKELLPNWSRNIQMSSNTFNRNSLIEYSNNGYIVLVSPTEDGIGGLMLSKYDKELKKIDEYEIELKDFNINQIYPEDIIIMGDEIYWRNYKDNSLYLAKFDEDYKSVINTTKIIENINSFNVEGDIDELYLAVANLDGSVDIYIKEAGDFVKQSKLADIKNASKVKLLLYDDVLYLQSIEKIDEYESDIYITEFKDNIWTDSLFLSTVSEFRVKIRDIDLGIDNKYVYSLVTTQRDGSSECISFLNGYEQENRAPFKSLKLEWAVNYGVNFFTDAPTLISGNDDGIEILTVAPSSLTKRYDSSNVISMILTPDGLKDPVLVSNSRNTSSNVDYLDIDDNRYVFWNEYDELGRTGVMGASNKASIIESSTVVTKEDINYAIDKEISAFSYLIILCFGARLLSIFPALAWLLCLVFFNEKLDKKYYLSLIIGIVIFLVFQLFTMDFYYSNSSMFIMPKIINFTNANYIVPVIFAIISSIFAYIYKKEGDSPEVYKVYAVYLLFYHIMLNFLYAPYLI